MSLEAALQLLKKDWDRTTKEVAPERGHLMYLDEAVCPATGRSSTSRTTVEAAIEYLEKDWSSMSDGKPLEGFDLVYPDEAVCFTPATKAISKDGASIKLAPIAALGTKIYDIKSWEAAGCLERQGIERLLLNASAPAFPAGAPPRVYLKLRIHQSEGFDRDHAGIWKKFVLYEPIATQVSVGWLCYHISKWYTELLEYVKKEGVITWPPRDFHYTLSDAHLYDVILSKKEMKGVCVWDARIRHGNKTLTT